MVETQERYLTLEDENQLISLRTQYVGSNLSGKLFVDGAREVFKKGIVWGAKEFKIE